MAKRKKGKKSVKIKVRIKRTPDENRAVETDVVQLPPETHL